LTNEPQIFNNRDVDIQSKRRIAFVASGGAVKAAAFHVGAILALQERGFTFCGGRKSRDEPLPTPPFKGVNLYVGSSAGSFVTATLAAGYPVESLIQAFGGKNFKSFKQSFENAKPLKPMGYVTMFGLTRNPTRRFATFLKRNSNESPITLLSFESFLRRGLRLPGLFSSGGIEQYYHRNVFEPNNFEELGAELYIVTTQLNHSRKVIFSHKNMEKSGTVHYSSRAAVSQAIAASIALPPIYEPYPIPNDRGEKVYYLDGEVRETLNTHVAKDAGADLIFISYTHQPYHYDPKIGSLTEFGLPAICVQALYQAIEQKINSSRRRKKQKLLMLDTIGNFFDENRLDPKLKKKLQEHVESVLGFRRDIDYVYIHPKPRDHEMFFGDHFSLNPKITEKIVRIGFRCALEALREHGL
jgi:predicted acylesterase/phospholipase RssA